MSTLLAAFNKSIAQELTDRLHWEEWAYPEDHADHPFHAVKWSEEQLSIFEWFQAPAPDDPKSLVVVARAGTGKTTTIMVAANAAPESDDWIEAKTLHSLGFGFVRCFWEGIKTDFDGNRAFDLARAAAPNAPDEVIKLVAKLHTKGREIEPLARSGADLVDLAVRFECEPDESWEDYGWDVFEVCNAAYRAMELAAERPRSNMIDFADMLYLPVRNRWIRPRYDLVVIDEAQDMNPAQIILARGVCRSRLVVVGDDRQCHPPGTMIEVDKGTSKPIEELANGDLIRAWDRNAQRMLGGRRVQVASRSYDGPVFVARAHGREVTMTPDHKVLCRWTDRTTRVCVTYLMWRPDLGFRVGWCQLFNKGGQGKMFHLAHRARMEKAEKTWVLDVHEGRTDASITESVIATNYGIPTITFEPVHGATHLTRESIDLAFSMFAEKQDRGLALLADYNLSFDLPLYPWPGMKLGEPQGRRTYFEVYAANLLPDLMSMPIPDGPNQWASISSVGVRQYCGLVYSLGVEKDHAYAANGIVVRNCIYSFRGADSGVLGRIAEETGALVLGLKTTYRCARSIVEAARAYVPDFAAGPDNPDGLVDDVYTDDLLDKVQPGDAVLSRTNAPLISLGLRALRRGLPAVVAGKQDLAMGLKSLIKKLATGDAARSVPAFLSRLSNWREREITRAMKLPEHMVTAKVDAIVDKVECLAALADGVSGVAEIYARLDQLFDAVRAGRAIHFSSVHKAKGLEWTHVYVLASTLRSGGEESNIAYVAITRAKSHLTMAG